MARTVLRESLIKGDLEAIQVISESAPDCTFTFQQPWLIRIFLGAAWKLKPLFSVILALLLACFPAVYEEIQPFLPNMYPWQCAVSEDRSLRHCGVNDIKRPGIQPQPIHMQMASLALTLINSLWVHSFHVNKDLAAFERSGTLSRQRQRERGLVADLTVKPPQDIMQPPCCGPNPAHRGRTEPALVQGMRRRRQRKAALLFFIPSQQQKSSKTPWLNAVNDLRLSQSRAVCPADPMNENGSCCSIALHVFAFQQCQQHCRLTDCMLTTKSATAKSLWNNTCSQQVRGTTPRWDWSTNREAFKYSAEHTLMGTDHNGSSTCSLTVGSTVFDLSLQGPNRVVWWTN